MYKKLLLLILLASGGTGLFAQDTTNIIFKGYMRSGFGTDGQGNALDVFRAPNAEAKYRLGNEAETYAETAFGYAIRDDQGARFESQILLAFVAPTSKSNSFQTTTSVREAFVRADGLTKGQKGLTFWAGQRYYNRLEIHINDYWPRDMTGFGGGIENLQLGSNLKMALAYLGGSIDELDSDGTIMPENRFAFNKTTVQLRLYDFQTGFGNLSLYLDYAHFSGDQFTFPDGEYTILDNNGWAATIQHHLDFEGGRNLLYMFYGKGAAENGRAIITQPLGLVHEIGSTFDPAGISRFRIIDDLKVDFSPRFSMLGLLMFQHLDNGMDENNTLQWLSAGIRPVWFFNRYFSLVGEFGLDHSNQTGALSGQLFKATLAPQISPLNIILTRPALRAYITYATWSDDFIGSIATVSYPDKAQGISIGLQMEVWW